MPKAKPSVLTKKGRRYRPTWPMSNGKQTLNEIKTHVIMRHQGYIAYQFIHGNALITKIDHERSGKTVVFSCPRHMVPRMIARAGMIVDGRVSEKKARRIAPKTFIDTLTELLL